jgi:ATP-binding cassette subfamily B protein
MDFKVTSKRRVLNFLLFFLKKFKKEFFIISLCATIVNVSSNTFWPLLLGDLTDALAQLDRNDSKDLSHVLYLMALVVLYWVTATLAHSVKGFFLGATRPKFCAAIRQNLLELVIKYRHSYFVNKYIGDLSQRISEIPKSAQLICDNLLTVFIPIIFSIILSSFVFFSVHPIPSMMFILFLLSYLLITIIIGKRAANHFDESYKAFGELFGTIVDSIRNHFNIRIFNGFYKEKEVIKKFQAKEIMKAKKAFFFVEKLKLALGLLEIVSVTAILAVSVFLWKNNALTIGELVFIANSLFNIMTALWFAVDEITYTFSELGICQQGLKLLDDEAEDSQQNNNNYKELKIVKGDIEFDKVSFQYKDGLALFQEKSLLIKGREKIGLVGFSGSGKTTFVQLIMGLYQLKSGKILIDGQDITQIPLASLRKEISFIQQDPILFHRTIKENIAYGKFDATDAEIIEASIKAHAHDFIINMPDGYNSTVGEMGTKLSGGQRQRIAIARAILRNAPILIMDEATSALDTITEKKIQASLNYLMKGKTVIVIAHRLSTVLHMDKIIVFDKGNLIEEGTHKELLIKKGHYKKLWDMQQDGILPEEQCED